MPPWRSCACSGPAALHLILATHCSRDSLIELGVLTIAPWLQRKALCRISGSGADPELRECDTARPQRGADRAQKCRLIDEILLAR